MTSFGYSDFRFKCRREIILSYSDFSVKSYGKTALCTIISLWVSFPNDTNWEFIFLMHQSYMQRHV